MKTVITEIKTSNKPSQEILDLIEKSNMIPSPAWLPDVDKILTEESCKTVGATEEPCRIIGLSENRMISIGETASLKFDKETLIKTWNRLKSEIKKYPKLLMYLENILESDTEEYEEEIRISTTITFYRFFIYTVSRIRIIAKATNEFAQTGIETNGLGFSESYYFTDAYYRTDPIFSIKNGKLTFLSDRVSIALEGIDARRIRICPICTHIFWAYRLDAQACSNKCSNARRQKRWYSKPENKEQFLRNKQAKYHQNKKDDRFPSRLKKEAK